MRRALSLLPVLALAVVGCSSDLTVPITPEAGRGPDGSDAGEADEPAKEAADEGGGDAADASDAAPVADEDYAVFSLEFSRLYCRRVFSCCTVDDRIVVAGMVDEATCVLQENEVVSTVGVDYLTHGLSTYDRDTATACLRDLTSAPCATLFSRDVGRLVACQGVLKGLGPNGTDCERDVQCLTNHCTAGGCADVPAPRCMATEFFDVQAAACVAKRGAGGACLHNSDCVPELTCLENECTAPLSDGEPCISPSNCAGTCTTVTGVGIGVCRPPLCRGL
jgi:hypothetical protein